MERTDFDTYSGELLAACETHPSIIGLVLMGSTADTARVDKWSDHDFAVIVRPGEAESLRADLSWLPRHAALVSIAREVHDGFCGLYDDGHVIEFGITDLEGLRSWHANAYSVAIDRGGVVEAMGFVASREKPTTNFGRDFAIFIAAIVTGVGRARRGEVLSASGAIRGRCVELMLGLLASYVSANRTELDDLDVRRRFERAYPELGAEIEIAQQQTVVECARQLLVIADRELGGIAGSPREAVAVARGVLET